MTDREVEMAKRLQVSPETLIRNQVSRKTERWKDPVPLHTRRRYEERFEKDALSERAAAMKRIGKKAEKDPVTKLARKLGFTRSECFMARALRLTETDLERLRKQAKKDRLSAPLLVRRMYERASEEKTPEEGEAHGRDEREEGEKPRCDLHRCSCGSHNHPDAAPVSELR